MNFSRKYKNKTSAIFIIVFTLFLLFPLLNLHHHLDEDKHHICKDETHKVESTTNEFKEICFECELNKLFFNQKISKDIVYFYSLCLDFFYKNLSNLILPFFYFSVILLKLGRAPPKLIHL